MPKTRHPRTGSGSGLAAQIAVALSVKAVALAVLYLAFFVPPGDAAGPERAAAAIFGLPSLR
jgi:hypothetical protein